MFVHIYRSSAKPDTYLYLAQKDDFSEIPEGLLASFGEAQFSFSFEISSRKKLAKENTETVLANLKSQGYHLQLQDNILVEQMLALKSLN